MLTAKASITLTYKNNDASDLSLKINVCGAVKNVKFVKSVPTTVTIPGDCTTLTITSACGDIIVKDGQKVSITNGCAKIANF